MKIFLPELQTSPQRQISFDYTIDLSREQVNFGKPFARPVAIFGTITDSAGMVRLSGNIEAVVSTRCARCNTPFDYDKSVAVSFLLATSLDDEDIDDIYLVEGDTLELDDIFIPELIMDMEMAPLCHQDCKGLCQKCGANLNESPCACNQKEIDPRLQQLQDILKKLDK